MDGTQPARASDRVHGPCIFHGWYIVAASLAITTVGMGGGLYLFGVMLPPLLSDFRWTRADLSGANSLAMIVMGLLGPVVGRLIDRYDARWLMVTGAVCCGLGFGAQSVIGTVPALSRIAGPLAQLYACYALYGAGLAGVGFVPVNTIVSRWFTRRRGLALGIVSVGIGLGGLLTIPAGWLIDRLGWRAASALIGFTIAAVAVPLELLVIRSRPEDMGLAADGDEAPAHQAPVGAAGPARPESVLWSSTFWALSVAFGIYTVAVTIVRVFGIALLQDKGLEAPAARAVMGALAIWGIVGKVVCGGLADRVPVRAIATSAFLLEALGTLFLLGPATALATASFAAVYGVPMGGIAALQPLVVAKYFGSATFGAVYGTLMLFLTFAAAAGPVLAGRVYDLGAGYQPTLVACSVATAAAAGLMLVAKKPSAVAHEPPSALRP